MNSSPELQYFKFTEIFQGSLVEFFHLYLDSLMCDSESLNWQFRDANSPCGKTMKHGILKTDVKVINDIKSNISTISKLNGNGRETNVAEDVRDALEMRRKWNQIFVFVQTKVRKSRNLCNRGRCGRILFIVSSSLINMEIRLYSLKRTNIRL